MISPENNVRNTQKDKDNYPVSNRELAELLPDIIFETDMNLNLVYANSIAFQKFGYTEDEFENGINLSQLIAPQFIERASSNIKELLKGKITKPNKYMLIKKDESHFYARVHSRPIFSDGKVVGIRGVIHDISEMVKAEQKLRESEEKYRSIIRASPNLIFLFDDEGTVIECNRSAELYLEVPKKKIIDKKIYDLLSNLTKEMTISIFDQFRNNIKKEIYDPIEFTYISSTGQRLWYQLYYSFVRIGENTYIHVALQDFTKLKEAEEIIREENKKLTELNKIRKNFLDIASHELKTPLTSVYGSIQLLYELNKDILSKESLKFIEIAKNGSERLKNLMLNLLDISILESKKFILYKKRYNLVDILKNCVNDMKYLSYKRNHFINLDLPEALYLDIDKSGIERVIINLLSNAIKYTPPEGLIEIKLRENDSNIELSVKDNGIGLTEDEIKKIFEKFSKIKRSKEEGMDLNKEGTGLGLYISKEIIELHDGQIWVTSEGRNKGSTFIVRLPMKSV